MSKSETLRSKSEVGEGGVNTEAAEDTEFTEGEVKSEVRGSKSESEGL